MAPKVIKPKCCHLFIDRGRGAADATGHPKTMYIVKAHSREGNVPTVSLNHVYTSKKAALALIKRQVMKDENVGHFFTLVKSLSLLVVICSKPK